MPFAENKNSDFLEVVRADSDEALLVFAHRGARHFAFYKILSGFSANLIFVRDPTDGWYNGPIPTLGKNLDETVERIRHVIETLGVKRAATMGSSMGGYAAILFGCLLKADAALAFSPQTLLDPMFPLSPARHLPCVAPDLNHFVGNAGNTITIDVVCSENDVVDFFNAARLSGQNINKYIIPESTHEIVNSLYKHGNFLAVITEWFKRERPAVFMSSSRFSDLTGLKKLESAVLSFHRGSFLEATRFFQDLVLQNPGWPGIHFFYGQTLLKTSKFGEAADTFRNTIALHPKWFEPYRFLGRALWNLNDREGAVNNTLIALELNPDWAEAWFDLGEYKNALGDKAGAKSAWLRASTIKPSWTMPQDRLAREGV